MIFNSLSINNLELSVNLGWTEGERLKEQIVLLDLTLQFAHLPSACQTDKLEDTVCYSILINQIRSYLKNKKFNLIEHLVNNIYLFLKSILPRETKVTLTITKQPKIPEFSGQVCFYLSDERLP